MKKLYCKWKFQWCIISIHTWRRCCFMVLRHRNVLLHHTHLYGFSGSPLQFFSWSSRPDSLLNFLWHVEHSNKSCVSLRTGFWNFHHTIGVHDVQTMYEDNYVTCVVQIYMYRGWDTFLFGHAGLCWARLCADPNFKWHSSHRHVFCNTCRWSISWHVSFIPTMMLIWDVMHCYDEEVI